MAHPIKEEDQLFPGAADAAAEAFEVGRLSVDVFDAGDELVLRSPIAGVRTEDLELSLHNDMLTIRGTRHVEEVGGEGRYLVRECHWGAFTRSLILPTEIDADRIAATIKDGILTVRLPKIHRDKRITVRELP